MRTSREAATDIWSAVASVARHRFGYFAKMIQSAVDVPTKSELCRRTPNSWRPFRALDLVSRSRVASRRVGTYPWPPLSRLRRECPLRERNHLIDSDVARFADFEGAKRRPVIAPTVRS